MWRLRSRMVVTQPHLNGRNGLLAVIPEVRFLQ